MIIADSELNSLHAGYLAQVRNDADHPGYVFLRDRLTAADGVAPGSVFDIEFRTRLEAPHSPGWWARLVNSLLGGATSASSFPVQGNPIGSLSGNFGAPQRSSSDD
ncbi:hypothetical protein [Streptomyces brasiliensis]|uniref:Uncharacterized protein n=1 Tax=Streptomyces brasiliensis TaxID=1954 RepID=A0A917LA55_9ACTN|nr:hypothetical protein [Streptomyces brasiliensis]GGJ52991.1 hypothetical protein GCM10010121_074740 [Streptomyces brasiliensis]